MEQPKIITPEMAKTAKEAKIKASKGPDPLLILVLNNLIAERYKPDGFKIKKAEIENEYVNLSDRADAALSVQNAVVRELRASGKMNSIEGICAESGWSVRFNMPEFNGEGFEPYYEFQRR